MSGKFKAGMDAVGKIVPVASVIVAVIALYVSHNAFQKQLDQSQKQLELSMTVAKAQVKPYLTINRYNIGGEDKLVLKNAGPGTAIINKVTLFKDGKKTDDLDLKRLFDTESSREYASTFETFAPPQPIMSGDKIDIIKLDERELKDEGFSATSIAKIAKIFQEEAKRISIEIEYEDILHNPQDKIETTLQINPYI